MHPINILVSSAGTASAINVIKSLRAQQEYTVWLLAVDVDQMAAGLYLADAHDIVPRYSDPDYIPHLLDLCQQYDIKAFYPIYSKEIEIIASHLPHFQDLGIAVLLPHVDVIRRCNDKRAMYDFVMDMGILAPRFIKNVGQDTDLGMFPLFAKPNQASGTTGAIRIESQGELAYVHQRFPDFLYQEFIEGQEYTVDILCDRQHQAIAISPRLRLATKAGQSVKGRTINNLTINHLCEKICQAIGMIGPCNIQFIERDDEFVFIELNPRYAAGGLMLTVHAGANLPLMALKLMMGEEIEHPTIRSNVVMLRYWEEVFRDDMNWRENNA